jgi:prophage regulatory protein
MNRFLRLPEVMRRVPYSRPTLYRKIAAGRFPKPYDLDGNGRTVAWLESEIEAWIVERVDSTRNTKVA